MREFHVYILECSDGSYYTGYASDVESRISTHKLGLIKSCYTYTRKPVKVVYYSSFSTKDEAFCAERQIKGWSKRKKMALINGEFDLLRYLSKNSEAKYQPSKCEKLNP